MAVLLFGGGLLAALYMIQKTNDDYAYTAYLEERETMKENSGFSLTRQVFSPFQEYSKIIGSPDFPANGTPFIRSYEAVGNLGFEKLQYVTPQNGVYEIAKGREHCMFI